eukprot:UC1_evm6s153
MSSQAPSPDINSEGGNSSSRLERRGSGRSQGSRFSAGSLFKRRGSNSSYSSQGSVRSTNDEAKLHYFMRLALSGQAKLQRGDVKGCIPFFVAALAERCGDARTLATVHSQLGIAYCRQKKYEKAIRHHEHDLDLARQLRDHKGVAAAYSNAGMAFKGKGSFNEALQCFEKELQVARLTRNRGLQAKAHSQMAACFQGAAEGWQAKGDESRAHDMFLQALESYKEAVKGAAAAKDLRLKGRCLGNMGLVCEQLGHYDRAVTHHKARLKVAQKLKDRSAQSRAYCNLGNVHRLMGKVPKSIGFYEKDIGIAVALKDKVGEAITCSNIGNAYQSMGRVKETLYFHKRHVTLLEEAEHKPGMIWGYRNLGKVYEMLGRFGEALDCYNKQLNVSASLKRSRLEQLARDDIERVNAARAQGITIDASAAVNALKIAATEEERNRLMSKRTIRGTISRLIGRKRTPLLQAGAMSLGDVSGGGTGGTGGTGGGGGGGGLADGATASSGDEAKMAQTAFSLAARGAAKAEAEQRAAQQAAKAKAEAEQPSAPSPKRQTLRQRMRRGNRPDSEELDQVEMTEMKRLDASGFAPSDFEQIDVTELSLTVSGFNSSTASSPNGTFSNDGSAAAASPVTRHGIGYLDVGPDGGGGGGGGGDGVSGRATTTAVQTPEPSQQHRLRESALLEQLAALEETLGMAVGQDGVLDFGDPSSSSNGGGGLGDPEAIPVLFGQQTRRFSAEEATVFLDESV